MTKKLNFKSYIILLSILIFMFGCGSNANPIFDVSTSNSKEIDDSELYSVNIGKYPQKNNKPEPIEWLVLDNGEEDVLLLSKYVLIAKPWSNINEGLTWDKSYIRNWLNGEFFNTVFSENEKEVIVYARINNADDLKYGTKVGEDTLDRVFLLSANEALRYLKSENRTVTTTEYAIREGIHVNNKGNSAWWLRSPGMLDTGPAYFASSGEIGSRAHRANESIIGIRPAIRVKKSFLKGK